MVRASTMLCLISTGCVPCGATSTRSGLRSSPSASSAISSGMVAEKSIVWRAGCVALAMRRTSLMKPMSSMRSASSSTSQVVSASTTSRSRTRSVKRPGVATSTSTPGASFFTWLKRDTPPSTSAVEICAPFDSLRIVSSICTASSRVGARISARAVFGRRLSPSAMIFDRIGSAKAAVLPEPVWAMPNRSRPSSCAGMALIWIGFGSMKPAALVALKSWPVIPSSAKPNGPALFSICNFFFFQAALRPQTTSTAGRNLPQIFRS